MKSKSDTKTILVIEDDSIILFTIVSFLESNGYSVQTAVNGLEGLNRLKIISRPNLILLDMKMPVLNGRQFISEYNDKYHNLSPIVVMTAAADIEQQQKEIHAAGWIGKPFDLNDLLETVKMYER